MPPFTSSFFFSSAVAPRHLHSFPTRRSSDLHLATGIVARSVHVQPVARRIDRHRQLRRPDVAREQDRKSTRLNSSHRCISYAVFCLKKKKNKEDKPWTMRSETTPRVVTRATS